MNEVRVLPVRSFTGRVQGYAVEAWAGPWTRWWEVAFYKNHFTAMDFAHKYARNRQGGKK